MCVHAILEVERWRHVDIVEQGEVAADWNRVIPSVAPVLYQVRLEELVFFGVDTVGYLSGVRHRNLLIPTFIASCVLALEGIESRERDIEVGQRYRQCRVAHVLREVGSRAERESDA